MDAIASARVPVEIKQQGDRKLKEIGSNTTSLINAAYAYLLDVGALPKAPMKTETRSLSVEDAQRLRDFISATTLPMPDSWQEKSYEELYDEAMRERYAEYFDQQDSALRG